MSSKVTKTTTSSSSSTKVPSWVTEHSMFPVPRAGLFETESTTRCAADLQSSYSSRSVAHLPSVVTSSTVSPVRRGEPKVTTSKTTTNVREFVGDPQVSLISSYEYKSTTPRAAGAGVSSSMTNYRTTPGMTSSGMTSSGATSGMTRSSSGIMTRSMSGTARSPVMSGLMTSALGVAPSRLTASRSQGNFHIPSSNIGNTRVIVNSPPVITPGVTSTRTTTNVQEYVGDPQVSFLSSYEYKGNAGNDWSYSSRSVPLPTQPALSPLAEHAQRYAASLQNSGTPGRTTQTYSYSSSTKRGC